MKSRMLQPRVDPNIHYSITRQNAFNSHHRQKSWNLFRHNRPIMSRELTLILKIKKFHNRDKGLGEESYPSNQISDSKARGKFLRRYQRE